MNIKTGTTRICILIGNYAIKIPKFKRWKIFLRGLLANIDENYKWNHSKTEQQALYSKVKFCSWWGIVLIMDRCKVLSVEEYNNIDFSKFIIVEPIDNKIENFGTNMNGSPVLVDYADSRYMCSDCSSVLKRCKN